MRRRSPNVKWQVWLGFLAATDVLRPIPAMHKVKQNMEHHALNMEVTSCLVHDESALFEEDEVKVKVMIRCTEKSQKETSKQQLLSQVTI